MTSLRRWTIHTSAQPTPTGAAWGWLQGPSMLGAVKLWHNDQHFNRKRAVKFMRKTNHRLAVLERKVQP